MDKTIDEKFFTEQWKQSYQQSKITIHQLTMRCDQLVTALTKVSQFPECPEGILKITTNAIEEWG